MINKRYLYYVGDDVTLRGVFKIEGVEQTPDADSLTVSIYKKGVVAPVVSAVAGTIIGNQLTYKYSNLVVGQFTAFLTAQYNEGADERTGVIEFLVRTKEAS